MLLPCCRRDNTTNRELEEREGSQFQLATENWVL